MELVGIGLVVFASARLTRLLVIDAAGEVFRVAIRAGFGVFGDRAAVAAEDLLECPFCIGFWISLGVAGSFVTYGDALWWNVIALALSVSYLAGHLVARLDARDDRPLW